VPARPADRERSGTDDGATRAAGGGVASGAARPRKAAANTYIMRVQARAPAAVRERVMALIWLGAYSLAPLSLGIGGALAGLRAPADVACPHRAPPRGARAAARAG